MPVLAAGPRYFDGEAVPFPRLKPAASAAKPLIVIDPGHGGIDSGAIGVNGIYEKDVVLNIAKAILKLNKSLFDNELDIYLTRYNDTLISLSDRSQLVKNLKANVFVS